MVEARDIIAKAVAVAWCGKGAHVDPIDNEAAHAAIAALTAAGWTLAPTGSRVVPEGGVDAETVRKCMDAAYTVPDYVQNFPEPDSDGLLQPGSPYDRGAYDARQRIRALAEAKP